MYSSLCTAGLGLGCTSSSSRGQALSPSPAQLVLDQATPHFSLHRVGPHPFPPMRPDHTPSYLHHWFRAESCHSPLPTYRGWGPSHRAESGPGSCPSPTCHWAGFEQSQTLFPAQLDWGRVMPPCLHPFTWMAPCCACPRHCPFCPAAEKIEHHCSRGSHC